jgi:hypothetical protein
MFMIVRFEFSILTIVVQFYLLVSKFVKSVFSH